LPPEEPDKEEDYAARYLRWKASARHDQLLSSVALIVPQGSTPVLRSLDLDKGIFQSAEWPGAWSPVRERYAAWLSPEPWENRRPPGPPPEGEGLLIELPRFGRPPRGPRGAGPGPSNIEWLIVEVNLSYVQTVILPELLQRYLGSGGDLDYQAEVVTRSDPPALIYGSDPVQTARIGGSADASVGLFELQYDQIGRRGGPLGGRGGGRGRGLDPGGGRWELLVRHRAGSLEAVVSRARSRNLAVAAGILALMLVTVAALIWHTRQAQRLAGLQMEFAAGVSHELRTPLTVINTLAYNLRGKMAYNPSQVERYGALIQWESGKLTALVEQVLRFAGAQAGHVIREREPVSVEAVIEDSLQSSKALLEESGCAVEKRIEAGLPLILGDPTALKHAIQNLFSNAAKYGTEGSNWIGISASKSTDGDAPVVEIRVADRGPGIPPEEQQQIFDPFYRGRRALEDQIHGTGLGLTLVKGIVEAHGGTISVRSEPMKGTEFALRIPAAPPEYQDEFTHSAG
jgi:signal transduction histidine kinase